MSKVPEQLAYKISSLAENEKINQGSIEVTVLFGENLDKVVKSVEKIGGIFEDLGFGFGIVTVKASDIRKVYELEGVQYAELPKVVYTSDLNSNRAACVPTAWSNYGVTGEGVLVGFIDTGIDYTHPAFLDENGNTRIEYIYDLGESKKVYDKVQINQALKAQDSYSVVDVQDPLEHGTHVAGIACGGGKAPRQNYGVAYKSSIAMVKTTRKGFLNFSLSTQIMRGVKFLNDKSSELNKPLVINVSLSTNDGAHNGTSLLEQYIETITRLERIAIVIAAGNEGDAAHHAGGQLSEVNEIPLGVSSGEPVLVLQLYKPLLIDIAIIITNPMGEKSSEISLNEGYSELNIGTDRCIIYNTGPRPFDINGEIIISLVPSGESITSGEWKITLKVLNKYSGSYDMWLPITETLSPKTRFLNPDVYNTLGIPATVEGVISVGSYNYMTNAYSSFSGRGKVFRRTFIKPDVVAPGEGIVSAVPGGGYDAKSGTSMAAPHVAGICALLLEWGIVKGNDPFLYGERVKYYLLKGARRERTEVFYPDPNWGYGTVCANDTFGLLRFVNIRSDEKRQENQGAPPAPGVPAVSAAPPVPTAPPVLPKPQPEYVFVEYDGDIVSAVSRIPGASVGIIDQNRAVLGSTLRDIEEVIKELGSIIIYVNPGAIFTLCQNSPVEASGVTSFYSSEFLGLNGTGVIVGIIDTGIDYLNEEFINADGTSRILSIFDQTENSGGKIAGQLLGSEFTREDINKAIQEKIAGRNPYSVVPSKDLIGHGTNMAGIVGARGKNLQLRGAAPNCDIAMVKIAEIDQRTRDKYCVYGDAPAYSNVTLFLAINYLVNLKVKFSKPIVIYIPLGTNMSSHSGTSSIEQYIDEVSKINGVTVVVPTGNEGQGSTHTTGSIRKQEESSNIELNVDKRQKNLRLEIWIPKPDKYSLSIISPSGEIMERIPPKLGESKELNFIYEQTRMTVQYSIPEEKSGDEKILVIARNIKEGIWLFRLTGEFVSTGVYDVWLSQREILAPETAFIKSVPSITLTTPSSSQGAISVSFYNQNNDSIEEDSGRGYTTKNAIKPDFAAGGIKALTTDPGGGTTVISGSSVAGAVTAGCVAILLEWGIVKGNDTELYGEKVKTYMIRGTLKRPGDEYPNPYWGYGIINMREVFNNIRQSPPEKSENLFLRELNLNYLIEYKGNIADAVKNIPDTAVYIVDNKRAILSVPADRAANILTSLPEVVFYDPGGPYTVTAITPAEASKADLFYKNVYLPLDGNGVIIGLIDTGIDYLNEEFINEDGTSKILTIWDQSIEGNGRDQGLIQGSVFTKEEIDKAIATKKNGGDPYTIVPSKDSIGHGTKMAGIISARGVNPSVRGIAPASSLAIVKLMGANKASRNFFGVYGEVESYRGYALFLAVKYLFDFSSGLKRPIAIYIPHATNVGAHNGDSYLERYIDEISNYNGTITIVPAGNEGISRTHTSGIISSSGEVKIIELKVAPEQRDLFLDIWISKPDKVALSITSPTGEVIRRIASKYKKAIDISFIYEETKMTVEYSIPDEVTGEERITVVARNIREGIWQFKLIGELIYIGKYDAWILQRELLAPGTRFLDADPDTTLTIPSTSDGAITVGYYNQDNTSIIADSGRGYTRKGMIKPDLVAGGINQTTTSPGGGVTVISGASTAGAVVAGCTVLMLQWGIIDGNDITMFASEVKTYLIRGTGKRPGDIYPNEYWGYGMLDLKGVFDNIRCLGNRKERQVPEDGAINPSLLYANNNALVEYEGDLKNAIVRFPDTAVYFIDSRRAVVSLPYAEFNRIISETPEIVYVDPGGLYTLCQISAVEASGATTFHNNVYLPLDGTGVIIGIIDTGIDYLNEEFINEDGTSRILTIWNQDTDIYNPESKLFVGAEYSKEDIDKAIQAKRAGKDPYEIVPVKDEIGHGTNIAGIAAAKGINTELTGTAPGCSLAIVKAIPARKVTRDYFAVYGDAPAYKNTIIFLAVKYLYEFAAKVNKPMVICLPMGSTFGSHEGTSFVERYINEISTFSGI
ncbi:MAG: S8 family serine peptidase, partial [Clostridiaceae bacterium]